MTGPGCEGPAAAGTYVEPPLIDTHIHLFDRRMPLSRTAWARPDYDFGIEPLLEQLDRHRVPFGVIAAASLFDDYSDRTLAALERHPRLRGTVIVRPDVDTFSLRAMAARGVVGIRFVWAFLETIPDLTDPDYRRLLVRAADLGLHVQLFLDGPRLPSVLPHLAEAGVNVVVDHFGYPQGERAPDDAWFDALHGSLRTGRTWVKLSAAYRLASRAAAKRYAARLIDAAGPERLLWGSDAPFVGREADVTYADVLDDYHRLVPDPATRRTISEAGLRLCFF